MVKKTTSKGYAPVKIAEMNNDFLTISSVQSFDKNIKASEFFGEQKNTVVTLVL